MPNNILITPASASIQFSGSAANTIRLQVEPSGSVAFYGNSGTLFGITDSLSGSLMSVNDISGLPILEVFSDDRVVMGTFNSNTLVVTGSRVGIGTATPSQLLHVVGDINVSSGQGFRINDTATSGQYLRGNGTRFVASAIQAADVPTLNQNTTGTASNITAYTINQNLGTSNDVSHRTLGVNNTDSTTGYGVSLYGGAIASQPTYGLFFGGTATFGTHGAVTADWATYFTMNNTANRGWIFREMSTGTNVASISNAGYARFVNLGVGTNPATTGTGDVRASGEVTAYYSDARLKNFHGKILNAGEKVALLNGYYFTENETAKSLGYTNDKMQIGVSAQEVQAVLPEAVVPAPIDENYLTVKYEKLVPLLIEAIKELQAEVAILKAQKT